MKQKPKAKKHPSTNKKTAKAALLLPKKSKKIKQPITTEIKTGSTCSTKKSPKHTDYFSFFKKILIPEEPIAGLEISETSLRLVLLSDDKKTGGINTKQFFEQKLCAGIIVDGKVADPAKLRTALLDFKKSLKIPVDYVIASIPSSTIYSKNLSFPKNIEGQQLNEAIQLAVDFQFPYKAEDVYYSWEASAANTPLKIFVAEAPKKIIDPYISCIHKVFNLIALEFHGISLSRAISLEKNELALLEIPAANGTDFFIIKDNSIYFSRSIKQGQKTENTKTEAEKIINFYESASNENISAIIDINKDILPFNKTIQFPSQKNSNWLIALGAAERGLVPRQEDNYISLSPISPQKAYKYHKAVSFASVITGLTIGLGVFFTAAFLGTWILMITLQQQDTQKIDSFSSLPSMVGLSAVEAKIQNANSIISVTADILKNSPHWSGLIAELQKTIIDGIIVDGISLPAAEGTMTISGVAKDRNTLNQFRDKLKSSAITTNVNLPLTNLDQKSNIPFTISFELKDPTLLYKNPS